MQRDAFFPHLSFNCGLFFFFVLTVFFLKITSSETGGEQERRGGEKVTFVYTY